MKIAVIVLLCGVLFLLVVIGCHRARESDITSITGCTLTWTHPKVTNAPPVSITDQKVAQRLAGAFNDAEFLDTQKGVAWDCPLYDLVVTFQRASGGPVDVKVYLPRQRTFPGMWKHPVSGALSYFEVEKKEPKTLVDIIKPYLPKNAVYPETLTEWPPVEFNKGIPDFRDVNFPIFGDFSPDEFTKGR